METAIYTVNEIRVGDTVCIKNIDPSVITFLQNEYPVFCFKNGIINEYVHVNKTNFIKKMITNTLNRNIKNVEHDNVKPSAPIIENPPNYSSLYPKL
jgi:hypothetical protein